jgi:hypothetical protein
MMWLSGMSPHSTRKEHRPTSCDVDVTKMLNFKWTLGGIV